MMTVLPIKVQRYLNSHSIKADRYLTFSPLFPLTCARVRMHTGRDTSAQKKTWSTHKCSFQKYLCINVITNSDEFRWNAAQKKSYAQRYTQPLKR